MSTLPHFRKRRREAVEDYATRVFIKPGSDAGTLLRRMVAFEDNHWRAVFDASYFTLTEGEPSKSQWNTLKKRMKRMDPSVFIFKGHGDTLCDPEQDERCLYVDFGFFERTGLRENP